MSALVTILLILAFGVAQALIGGAKLVDSFPVYFLIGVAGILSAIALRSRNAPMPRFGAVPAALVLAGYVCLRAAFSPVQYLARGDFFMTLAALVVYLITALYLTRSSRRLWIFWVLIAFAAAHFCVGMIQFIEGKDFMALPWIFRPPDYHRRASGFYICPNHLAGLLEILAVMAVAGCVWGRSRVWVRLVCAFGGVLCLAGVAISGSRGGYLSTAAGILAVAGWSLWVISRVRRRHFVFYLASTILALGLGLWGALAVITRSDALSQRVAGVYDPENVRLFMWSAALKQFQLSPWLGTGAGTYYFYGREFRSEAVQADPLHVHNDYLELLGDYGVAGCALMAGFLGIHLYSGWRGIRRAVLLKLKSQRNKRSNELALAIGAMAGLTALIVHSVVDFNLHIPANTLLVAFLFGIVASPCVSSQSDQVEPEPEAPDWLRWMPAALGLGLAALAACLFPAEYFGERARIALRDSEFPESLEFGKKSLALDRKNPDVYYYVGEAQHGLAMDETDPAKKLAFHRAAADAMLEGLAVFPQDIRFMLKAGRTLDTLGAYRKAEELYQEALKLDPNFGNVWAYYGVHCHLQGKLTLAEESYLHARRLGEKEICPVGLKDLEKSRNQKLTPDKTYLRGFITPNEAMLDTATAAPPPPQ